MTHNWSLIQPTLLASIDPVYAIPYARKEDRNLRALRRCGCPVPIITIRLPPLAAVETISCAGDFRRLFASPAAKTCTSGK